ncbi:hypothetical protein [Streptomyces canus]|uniref:hypothetical protein n=1 Tax=Streptomyces canus TaxID=58343 RepID=UPI0022576D34|nr:hypothetical protein [Streptomyces canus]MCX4856962.1 hypothetical protein [Streptomyces canus]
MTWTPWSSASRARWAARPSPQPPAQPAEPAPAYVYLASQGASFVTAEILNATGGTPLP